MDELTRALTEFLAGNIQFSELDAALIRCLEADPSTGPPAFAVIDHAHRSGRLPLELYVHLKNRIARSEANASRARTPTPPIARPPTQAPRDDDRTVLHGAASSTPPGPGTWTGAPPTGPGAPPTGPGAPPGPGATPTSRTGTGTGATGTGATGTGATGTGTGATGTGTGGYTSPPRTGGYTSPPPPTGGSSSTWGTGSSLWPSDDEASQPPKAVEPGAVLKGRFVLESVVGRGGMGVVFRARDLLKEEAQDRNPYVAIKVLNDEFRHHPQSLKALQRESRKAQALAHPNIATVFDFDRDGSTVYMQMEFLEGNSLDKITRNENFYGMPPSKAIPLIEGLGRALAYAHDKGIVHSDFKPGNCFLTKDGVIKVFDFGIARAGRLPGKHQAELTEVTKFDPGTLGALTPAYASCEMIEGGDPDPRDDIYALGCVAYEILTGRHPFDKRSAVQARDAGLVPAPVKSISRRQQRALQKTLAFRREDRYSTVEEFLSDFGRQQRNVRLIASIAAIAVVALVGVLVVPGYLERRQVANIVAELSSGDDARIVAALDDFRALDAAAYRTVLPSVRDPLIAYFESEIASLVDESQGRYDFPGAQALLAEANDLMIDPRLTEIGDTLETRRRALVRDLDARFNESLSAGRLLPDRDGTGVPDILDILVQVDPGHELLSDPRLPLTYADTAAALLDSGNLELAGRLIELARSRFPSSRLVDLEDRLAALRARLGLAGLLLEPSASDSVDQQLERVAVLVDTASFDPAVDRELQSLLTSLGTALPADDATLSRAQDDAARWYLARATELRAQERFGLAAGLLDRAGELRPGLGGLDAERAALAEAESVAESARAEAAKTAEIEARKRSFASAAEANDLGQALETLSGLRSLLPADDEFLTETAPTALAGVYLARARESIRVDDLVAAEQYAREGSRVSSDPAFDDLLAEITARSAGNVCTAALAERGAEPDLGGACWDMLGPDARGPVLVVVPAGGGFDAPFAIGKFEASVGDWNRYCSLSGECELRADVADDRPLTDVSTDEIERYAAWLSERTGATYRLPTLSEWQYAANQPHSDRNVNCRGSARRSVDIGSENVWGLANYLGNVRERVAVESGYEYRGGSYEDTLCSVNLGSADSGEPDPLTGFRLLREL